MTSETKEDKSELELVGKDLKEVPATIVSQYGAYLTKLDLTDNQIRVGTNIDKLTGLRDLILDKNGIESFAGWPVLSQVTTLWVNNNKVKDISAFMDSVVKSFPNLTYLSIMMNPACPNMYLDDGEADAYQRHRYYVIHRLKKLQFLDASPVTSEERKVADVKGKFYKIAKPADAGEDHKEEAPVKTVSPLAPGAKPPKVATFLAKGKPRYDGTNSEGNRFIMNDDL